MHCYLVLEILSLCLVQYSKPSKRKLSMYEYVEASVYTNANGVCLMAGTACSST